MSIPVPVLVADCMNSLGYVTARRGHQLVGFVNVLWDGLVHAWIQDLMVSADARHQRVGVGLVHRARNGAAAAGCECLHVDFEDHLCPFYIETSGSEPTNAGLMRLQE